MKEKETINELHSEKERFDGLNTVTIISSKTQYKGIIMLIPNQWKTEWLSKAIFQILLHH